MSRDDELLSGRYRLGELIGVGGMSDVYTADDVLLGRRVAVKKMRADLARDENFLERFRREAKNAARLNHSAIVAIYDTGETDGPLGTVPFIVMELVQGETLRDIVRREGPMDTKRAAAVMADVCDALNFSHQTGIIHRDVKPANIMITNTGVVKVMDFGIARALGDSTTMTQTAAVIGTAQYLSPEQARGKPADARSDIYSVGCVLFEAITGEPPFTGETPLSVAYQHVQDEPPLPSDFIQGLSDRDATAIDAVLLTAMAKDPDERYDTAGDLADDLRRVANGEVPLAARPHLDGFAGSNSPTTTFEPQHGNAGRAGALGAGAAGLAAGAGMAGASSNPAADADFAGGSGNGNGSNGDDLTAVAPADYNGYDSGDNAGDDAGGDIAPVDDSSPSTKKKATAGALAAWSAVALLLVGTVGYVSYRMFTDSSQSQSLAIPQVKGMSAAEATKVLEDAGFVVDREDTPDPEIPRNFVIGTDPAFGSNVQKGSSVTLHVSSGPEITDVPDVRDKKAEEARKLLEEAGLKVDPVLREQPHEEIPRGHVIEQSPAAGSQVSKGTRVTLTVSSGIEMHKVPNLAGQKLDSARATLESMKFVVQVTEVDSTEPEGRVLAVPQAGQELTVGTTVELQVSKGNQIKMPDVNGKTRSEAESILRAAGFTGNINEQETDTQDSGQVGKVQSSSPSANGALTKDGEVTLVIYKQAPTPTPSPSPSPSPDQPDIPLPPLPNPVPPPGGNIIDDLLGGGN
ncbi:MULTISPECIES: Stk1 family PASTA domain-containing Ser/Thr kinase [unclassified Corynebacterium]|uniref:Stk1 family PASTA domain-containing Ser/Thr kinase n=1 Tax=unclassified Corynebacterium TaxID=2624378 RepID=UPI0030AB0CFB